MDGKACSNSTSGAPDKQIGDCNGIPKRDLSAETCRHFGYSVDDEGRHRWPRYSLDGQSIVGFKTRYIDSNGKKKFSSEGAKAEHLWGMQQVNETSKMIVITEGEIDCMSVSQAFDNQWAVVSLPNGVSSAKKSIAKCAAWLEQFPRVILMFDNDEAGAGARMEAITQLTPGKTYIATYPVGCKDANDVLMKHGERKLASMAWDAKLYRPDAVVSGDDLLDHIFREVPPGTPYEWEGLQKMLHGLRPKEIVMFCGGSGSGKSTVSRAVAMGVAYAQNCRVGYIALEETVQCCSLRMIAQKVGIADLHLDPKLIDEEKLRVLGSELGGKMDFLDMSFASSEAEQLKYNIKFLVQGLGCKFVFLDHISMVISGDAGENERKNIDTLMHSLRSLCQQLDAGFVVVSHLKRPGMGKTFAEGRRPQMTDLRGSASLEQYSDIIIGVSRNMRSPDVNKRNLLTLEILKNRPCSVLGPAETLEYSVDTGRLTPVSLEAEEVEDTVGMFEVG